MKLLALCLLLAACWNVRTLLAVEPAPAPATEPSSRPALTISVAAPGEVARPPTQPRLADKPEVFFLGPINSNFVLYDLLYSYLVENGVYIDLEDDDRLPEQLPWDLSQYKVVIVDPELDIMRTAAAKEHLENFVKRGGMVISLKRPATINWKANDPELYEVFDAVMSRGVRMQHPAFLKRNASRPDKDVILSCVARQVTVPGMVTWYRIGNDVAYMHFEGILKTADLYDRPDLRNFVLWMMEDIVRTHGDKRLPIFSGHLVNQFQKLGRDDYYQRTLSSLQPAETLISRVEKTRADNPFITCEAVCGLGYIAAVAKHRDPNDYYQPLVDMMKLSHEALFNPTTKLWAHGSKRGAETTPPWSRGHGWMLIGLVGIAETLPKDHPDYPLMVQYLEETAEGLAKYQDETGLWHCLVDDPNSRLEASGTGMILNSYCHAWRAGICRTPQVKAMLTKAWYGLKAHTVGGRTFSFLWGQGATPDRKAYSVNPSSGTQYLAPLAGPEYVVTFGPLVP